MGVRTLQTMSMLALVFALVAGATLVVQSAASASGSSGPISWSDDVVGTTTRTGSVFGTRCGSGSANAGEEAATLGLLDGWAATAAAAGNNRLSVGTTPAAGSDGDEAVITFPGATVTATVSRRQVPTASAADLSSASVGVLSANATFSGGHRMQDCAPRPANLVTGPAGFDSVAGGGALSGFAATPATFWNATTFPSGNQLDAVLFEFSEPVSAFGAWFGDLETRTPLDGSALAVVKLFDGDGNIVAASPIQPDESSIDDTVCGGSAQDSDGLGCGNQSTRFVGFAQAASTVSSMLVIVGDDDSCTQTSSCDGITEYLSWMGPVAALSSPDLTITKTMVEPFPNAPGDPATWTLDVSNIGGWPAAAGWMVEDLGDPSIESLSLAGDAALVDCGAGSSCVGLVPLAAGGTITVTATGTWTADSGVAASNAAHVVPAVGDVAELIPAGAVPSPGDDTTQTPTNNDTDAVHALVAPAPTTTAPPPATSTPIPTTTVTAPAPPTTTVTAAPVSTSPPSVPPGPASVSDAGQARPRELAFTGSTTINRALVGATLIGLGLLLVAASVSIRSNRSRFDPEGHGWS